MTTDIDKLSDDAASAVLDVIEENRRINRDDIAGAIKKAVMPHLGVPKVPGGFGVGAFLGLGDAVHVYRPALPPDNFPLRPDED